MAQALRTFPFDPGGAAGGTALPAGCVTLADLTALPRFGLKGAGSADWLAGAGFALPTVNRVATQDGMSLLRLGGEDFLLTAEDAGPALERIVSSWNSAAAPRGYSSWREEGWAWMRLSGPSLGDAMARLCALDLRPGRFAGDAVAQTRLAGVEVVLLRAGEAFDVFFDVTASAFVARAVATVEKHCAILMTTTGEN